MAISLQFHRHPSSLRNYPLLQVGQVGVLLGTGFAKARNLNYFNKYSIQKFISDSEIFLKNI